MKAFVAVAALSVLGVQNFNSEARAAEGAAGA
jgi:hypothetical protein